MKEGSRPPNLQEFISVKEPEVPYPIRGHPFFTVMIYGDKGSAKTTLGLSVPGSVLVLSYENVENVLLPISRFFGEQDRFVVKGFDQFVTSETGEMWKESSSLVYDLTIKILRLLDTQGISFDWVLVDGVQRFSKIAEMKMRYKNGIGAFAGIKNRSIWNERRLYVNEMFRMVHKVARHGVVFTSQNMMTETDDGTQKEPSWYGRLKDDVTTVIQTSIRTRDVGSNRLNYFLANVQTCKITGISKTYDITIKADKDGNITNSPLTLVRELLTTRAEVSLNW